MARRGSPGSRSEGGCMTAPARSGTRHDLSLVDQFGVLHDGARPYPGAVEALAGLREAGTQGRDPVEFRQAIGGE